MDLVEQLYTLRQIFSQGSYYDAETNEHRHRIPASVKDKDVETLKTQGHAPNNFITPEHNHVIRELKLLTSEWTMEEAADAFVASLWSAPFIWRAALTGKLLMNVMPEHDFAPWSPSTSDVCGICGMEIHPEDVTLRWYFSMIEGASFDGSPVDHLIALKEMKKTSERPKPTDYDKWTFRAILGLLRNLPEKTRYIKAAETLISAKLLPATSKFCYISLLENLALIGVLATDEYPGMATAFTTSKKRDNRPNIRVEVQAPLAWWDSSFGLNEKVLSEVFSEFDLKSASLDAPHPGPVPKLAETVTGAFKKMRPPRAAVPKTSAAAGKGPVEVGDVYAIRIREGVWVTAYCHEIKKRGIQAVPYARMEYMDGVYTEMPAQEELSFKFRGRGESAIERRQHWTSSIDSTSWVRRIARGIATPVSDAPEPDSIANCGAKELKYLASWCFPEIDEE